MAGDVGVLTGTVIGRPVEEVADRAAGRGRLPHGLRRPLPRPAAGHAHAQGPFPMETTYTGEPAAAGTRTTLRNRGRPSGFSAVARPVLAAAMQRANRLGLARLEELLECRPPSG